MIDDDKAGDGQGDDDADDDQAADAVEDDQADDDNDADQGEQAKSTVVKGWWPHLPQQSQWKFQDRPLWDIMWKYL